MASGTMVEGGGGNDGVREKQRFTESKVYTRKAYKGPKNNINNLSTAADRNISTTTAATTTKDNNNDKDKNLTTPNATETTTNAAISTVAKIDGENGYKDDKNHEKINKDKIQFPESQTASLEDKSSTQKPSILQPVASSDDSSGLSRQRDAEAVFNSVPELVAVDSVPEPAAADNNVPEPVDVSTIVPEPAAVANNVLESAAVVDSVPEPATVDNYVPEPAAAIDSVLEPAAVANSEPETAAVANSEPETATVVNCSAAANNVVEPAASNGVVKNGLENKVKISLASKSKLEKKRLRRKLESELDIVRNLMKKFKAKEGKVAAVGLSNNSQVTLNNRSDNGLKRINSEMGSVVIPRETTTPVLTPIPRQSRPLNQLSISVLENYLGSGEFVEKEKRTPKANQFYRNSEFLLAKDKFPPAESNKKSKLNGKRQGGGDLGSGFSTGSKMFKNCSALLEKLMKHKHGWVFNAPVDVKGLGLHDYFTIIKHPMDLGTIKSKLNKNWYKSPVEFAEDVRLTFHNAMTYNPKGQDVHVMAEMLLQIFEDRWAVIKSEYDREMRFPSSYDLGILTPTSRKTSLLPSPLDMRRVFDRPELVYDQRPKPMSTTPSSRTPAPKKPKAKDPHKRDMTIDEKQKLSTNLQSLPAEKLDNIVQIIKKSNSSVSQNDDEIEVDIDSVDAETLWELDRFVTNYKKNLSKNKRKAELAQARAAAQHAQQKASTGISSGPTQETRTDERNAAISSPVQVGSQGDNGIRSSSSSSSSSESGSSSSDSDSDSSSASGSDVGH